MGGWGMPNAYVFLRGGWVGLARCLRNQKTRKKGKPKKNVEDIAIKYSKNKKLCIRFIWDFTVYIVGIWFKYLLLFIHCHDWNKSGVGGFSKILRNFQSGSWQMITFAYKVGGWGEKRPKI